MEIKIRKYEKKDLPEMIRIWNEVVEDGVAFPQEELLDKVSGREFFAQQTYCGVAEVIADPMNIEEQKPENAFPSEGVENDLKSGKIYGLYILHPNNVGRCGHICNASYAVSRDSRGLHIGEQLVKDCLIQGKEHGYGVLQFNAVVANNVHARHLYERLGFTQLGTIPKGFRMKDGHYEDICPYYHEL